MGTNETAVAARSEMGLIRHCLDRIRIRLRLVRLFEAATQGLVAGAGLAVILVLARFLQPRYLAWSLVLAALPLAAALMVNLAWGRVRRFTAPLRAYRVLWIAAAALGLAAFVCMLLPIWSRVPFWYVPAASLAVLLLAGLTRAPRISPRAAAVFVDHRVGLKERVATALEYGTAATEPRGLEAQFVRPLLESAASACLTVRSARVGYGRLDRRVYAAAAAGIIAAIGLAYLSPLPAAQARTVKFNPRVISEREELAKALKELEKKLPLAPDALPEKPLQPLRNVLTDMNRNQPMDPLEAMARFKEAGEQMRKTLEKENDAGQAEQALKDDPLTQGLASAIEKLKQAQTASAKGEAGAADAKAQAERELQGAAQDLAGKLGGMSGEEKERAAKALDKAGSAAGQDKQASESLSQCAGACRAGDSGKCQSSLQDAGHDLAQQGSSKGLSGEALQQAIKQADDMAAQCGQDSGGQQGGSGDQQAGGDQGGQQGGQQGDQQGGQQAGGQQGGQQGGQPEGQQAGGQQGGQQGGQPGDQHGGDNTQGNSDTNSKRPDDGGGGSTEFANASGPGGKNNDRPIGKMGQKAHDLYGEHAIANEGSIEKAAGLLTRGPSAGSTKVLGDPRGDERPVLDYAQQLQEQSQRAAEAIEKNDYPQKYRDILRKYYSSSAPPAEPKN